MPFAEVFIISLLLVLIYMICKKDHSKAPIASNNTAVATTGPASQSESFKSYNEMTEDAIKEIHENFEVSATEGFTSDDCPVDLPFAKNDYGVPELDYNSFVSSQAVDKNTQENHSKFVKERENVTGSDLSGRTMAASQEYEYTPIDWQGIRGPFGSYIKEGNTQQTSEISGFSDFFKKGSNKLIFYS